MTKLLPISNCSGCTFYIANGWAWCKKEKRDIDEYPFPKWCPLQSKKTEDIEKMTCPLCQGSGQVNKPGLKAYEK